MRQLLAAFAVSVMVLAVTGIAQAATFDPANSTIGMYMGSLNPIDANAEDQGGGGTVTLVDNGAGGHEIQMEASVWKTINYSNGTSLFTGVPLIDDIRNTVTNAAMTLTSGFTHVNYLNNAQSAVGPTLGGVSGLSGKTVVWILGNPAITYPLSNMGGPAGGTSSQTLGGVATIRATYGPWVTAGVPITRVTTNVISYNGVTGAAAALRLPNEVNPATLSTGGGFVSTNGGLPVELYTVTISGTNNLMSATASQSGQVTLVAPQRINTGVAISGVIPGLMWMTLVFVPEPGTLLLLVTGAVGLLVIGRRQIRK
jgi:hypothetical protein